MATSNNFRFTSETLATKPEWLKRQLKHLTSAPAPTTTAPMIAKMPVAKVETTQVTKPRRLRQDTKGPNKTEKAFEEWLRTHWTFEYLHVQGVTLLLANGVRYTPDFVVSDGVEISAFETKGFMRDDASVKIKVAARVFPWIRFHLVTKQSKKDGGGWTIEKVLP